MAKKKIARRRRRRAPARKKTTRRRRRTNGGNLTTFKSRLKQPPVPKLGCTAGLFLGSVGARVVENYISVPFVDTKALMWYAQAWLLTKNKTERATIASAAAALQLERLGDDTTLIPRALTLLP